MKRSGFTLLEMLVATLIMGIAVVGLLSNISISLRNASRLTEYDRAAILARQKMGELLADRRLPVGMPLEGGFERSLTGGVEAGWRARVTPFESLPGAGPGSAVLERIELEIWWASGGGRRTLSLDGYRRARLPAQEQAQ
ncbi:MAG: type IV pilus modification PilV family protein [Rhodospirillales bacterium]